MSFSQRLAPQSLGLWHSFPRTFMGVAPRSSVEEDRHGSTVDSLNRAVRVGHAGEGLHRTCVFRTDSQVSSVFGSEERFDRAPNDSRSLEPQSVHPVPVLQDDDLQDCPSGPRPRVLDRHLGPKGRLLVRTDSRIVSELPGIPGGGPSVSLQGDAVRLKHRSSDLHQTRICASKGVEGKRHQDLCLSR